MDMCMIRIQSLPHAGIECSPSRKCLETNISNKVASGRLRALVHSRSFARERAGEMKKKYICSPMIQRPSETNIEADPS